MLGLVAGRRRPRGLLVVVVSAAHRPRVGRPRVPLGNARVAPQGLLGRGARSSEGQCCVYAFSDGATPGSSRRDAGPALWREDQPGGGLWGAASLLHFPGQNLLG